VVATVVDFRTGCDFWLWLDPVVLLVTAGFKFGGHSFCLWSAKAALHHELIAIVVLASDNPRRW
jgi:hypothetical protein